MCAALSAVICLASCGNSSSGTATREYDLNSRTGRIECVIDTTPDRLAAEALVALNTLNLADEQHAFTKAAFEPQSEIFMQVGAEPASIDAVRTRLTTDANVQSFKFITKDAAYQRFTRYFGKGQPGLVAQATPDLLPESFSVELSSVNARKSFYKKYSEMDGVDTVLYSSLLEPATRLPRLSPKSVKAVVESIRKCYPNPDVANTVKAAYSIRL